jgi:hypothetical protein
MDFAVCGVSGTPERSTRSVAFPQQPGSAGHGLTDVDGGVRPGREGADRRSHDLLPGVVDGEERPAGIRPGRQPGELARYEAAGVQAVAGGDREHSGPLCRSSNEGWRVSCALTSSHTPRQDCAPVGFVK